MQRGSFEKQPLAVGQYLATETYMIITFLWHYRLAPIYAKMYQKRQRPRGAPSQPSVRELPLMVFIHTVYRERDLYITPNASVSILKYSKIISVWGSIRFRPRWKRLNYSAPLPCMQLFQSWIENGRSNKVYIWCIPHSWNLSRNLSGGLFGSSRTIVHVFEKRRLIFFPRRNKHYFEMYQNRWYI